MSREFRIFAQLPSGVRNVAAVIAACRAGGVGVINGEFVADVRVLVAEIEQVAASVGSPFGIYVDRLDDALHACLLEFAGRGLSWVMVDVGAWAHYGEKLAQLRKIGLSVLVRVTTPSWPVPTVEATVDGVVLKGNESGGVVGEDSTFVLLQKWLGSTSLPLYVQGGLTPQVAAACHAVGAAGGVLDSQLLLLEDVRPAADLAALLQKLTGSETVAVGSGEHGEYVRVLVRPGHDRAKAFAAAGEGQRFDALRASVAPHVDWGTVGAGLLPIGQDICFAAPWRDRYQTMSRLFAAFATAVHSSLRTAVEANVIAPGAPLAQALNIPLPLVQGPMTRVSDRAEFARAVAEGGALPMVALALLRGDALTHLLSQTAEQLGDRPWGIGLLGFAPKALVDEQLAAALRVSPNFAIIAGGRPDQVVQLERAGIPSFLHVPASSLIGMFVRDGARRFIFEGRECGGHIGPLSSFVLWSTMVTTLVDELDQGGRVRPDEIHVLFAGGIHDAVSSAMVQVLAAPLLAKGVRVGILMGSAYLFTKQVVSSGAIVPRFQQEVVACQRTVTLVSGPGHASRCAYTPFAREFFRERERLARERVPGEEGRKVLDDLILGRLRIASKGVQRGATGGDYETLDEARQHEAGMYMLGQVATLRGEVTDVATLHADVCEGAAAVLTQSLRAREEAAPSANPAVPADVAIIGVASLLPGANSPDEYWDNIVDNLDTTTEIPRHRWDYRLYFDADRTAEDKIYSKWGGFLDDLVFDPTKYGMPPRSVSAIDPMQLIALEVAHRTLVDAGYAGRSYDHARTSIVLGASGGTGDVGTQYGVRAELPRFFGSLPESVAARLPEWTEDSFAGILANVIAGRVANRLNFGGVNFTTDAACASSLAALYQGVGELTAGRSDLVIVGGVDTVQGPFGYLCFSKTQALSPRGRCASFDVASDGIVISEGVAMVALKRLADAERDGDRIYAVVKGVAGSSDGRARGMTAPLPAGQLRAMRRAYDRAGFGPDTVGLFEAHGTGTVVGDTAELHSTTELVREAGARKHQAVIGSVKTMIGHTKATAGIAGLVKVALALHRRVLPPHHGVDVPNDRLQDEDCPLHLLEHARPWLSRPGQPRRGAVSAFGFGGTNFHAVLEEHAGEYRSWLRPSAARRWPAELLLWGAEHRDALVTDLERLRAAVGSGDTAVVLRDLAAGLAQRFSAGGETLALVVDTADELGAQLEGALGYLRGDADALPPGAYHRCAKKARAPGKVAVLFSGQGSQYPEMLRELMVHFEVCAETLATADDVLSEGFAQRFGEGRLLSEFVFPRGCYGAQAKRAAAQALTATDVAQPALGAVDAAAWHLMQRLGLAPDMFGGHSFGEFVALYAGGAIDLPSMLSLAAARGAAIVDASGDSGVELGTMAAVLAPRERVEAVIAPLDDVVVANHNAPEQIVVSGSQAAVAQACQRLVDDGIRVREFAVAAAFHSPQVEPASPALSHAIEATAWQPPRVPVYSNTTGRPHAGDVETTQRVMAQHLVRPVEFVAQTEAMYDDGARVFVELGPKSVLSRLVGQVLEGRPHLAVSLDGVRGLRGLLDVLAQLVCAGVELRLDALFKSRATPLADPYTLPVRPTVAKHAWLINGSGARRAGTPARQVGLTQEQALAQASPGARVEGARVEAEPVTPRPQASPLTPRTAHPMTDSDRSTMNGYFNLMRQFLETQERVMATYMQGGQPGTHRVPSERVLQPAPARAPAPAPIAAQPSVPAAAVAHGVPTARPIRAAVPQPTVPVGPTNGSATVAAAVDKAPDPPPKPPPEPAKAEPAAAPATDRAALADALLAVVEDKTGYPRDMVGLAQNLESDLGIDSIKRIEVVSAMLGSLTESHRAALSANLGELNTQPTLDGMLDILSAPHGAEASVPFDVAEAGAVTPQGHPPRYVIVPRAHAIEPTASRRLGKGHYLLADDALGVAEGLARRLVERGCTVRRISRETLSDEAALSAWLTALPTEGPLAGVIHLSALGAAPIEPDAPLQEFRRALQTHEKSLFLILRHCNSRLAEGAHVLAATGLGGLFGRAGGPGIDGLQLQGGAVGLLKSYYEERPGLAVRAVDLDPGQPVPALLDNLIDELTLLGGRHEVGYPGGRRTTFHTVRAPAVAAAPSAPERRQRVVLATGGGRGVTAEVLRELATPDCTLVVTGRRPLAEVESAETASATSAAELRALFIAKVRRGQVQWTLAEIGRRVQGVLATRELRNNLAAFARAGANVEYHGVDVTDEVALRAVVADVVARCGEITGILHGAGIIEDKLLADKTSASWSRVVETKVLGLWLLHKLVPLHTLEFFAVMSSVAGRYGNSGQSDYAVANELMNRLCCQWRQRCDATVNVMALCWGPWGPTQFGEGMVNAATEEKFAAKGVRLVTAAMGRRLFGDELRRAEFSATEVVAGEGPWEAREHAVAASPAAAPGALASGALASDAPASDAPSASVVALATGALLGVVDRVAMPPVGCEVLRVRLCAEHPYLSAHRIDGVRVLPAAAAVELLAEAAASLWPQWHVTEVADVRLLKGVEVAPPHRAVEIVVEIPSGAGSPGCAAFEVSTTLRSPAEAGRPPRLHYRAVVRLARQFPEAPAMSPRPDTERQVTVERAYGEWLFHGPCFQVIEHFAGLSVAGAQAVVRASSPAQWLTGSSPDARWLMDPALLDAGAQMAIVWARSFRDQTVLPARLGRITRYGDVLPARMRLVFECLPAKEPNQLRANVHYLDADGRMVLSVEDLQGVASASLNRLSLRSAPPAGLSLSTP